MQLQGLCRKKGPFSLLFDYGNLRGLFWERMLEQARLGATLPNPATSTNQRVSSNDGQAQLVIRGHPCRFPAGGSVGLEGIFSVGVTGFFPPAFSVGLSLLLLPG